MMAGAWLEDYGRRRAEEAQNSDGAFSDFTRGVSYLPYRAYGAPADTWNTVADVTDWMYRKASGGSELGVPRLPESWGGDAFVSQAAERGLVEEPKGTGWEMAGDILGQVATPGLPIGEMKAIGAAVPAIRKAISGQPASATTQVATTQGSYEKAINELAKHLEPDARVLDYGAGLGLGTDAMRRARPEFDIRSYEPFPERWRGASPVDFTRSDQLSPHDGLVNLNVLNVLEPALRAEVVSDIARNIERGGRGIVGTRGWSGDVAATKRFRPADEERALWVQRGADEVYQKGFDQDELIEYISRIAGRGFDVEPVRGITKSGAMLTRKYAEGGYVGAW